MAAADMGGGAERDQVIERGDARPAQVVQQAEQRRHGHGARAVGNQHQHAPAVQRQPGEPAADGLAQVVYAEDPVNRALPDDHGSPPCLALPANVARLAALLLTCSRRWSARRFAQAQLVSLYATIR
jgi:hypothetical protein